VREKAGIELNTPAMRYEPVYFGICTAQVFKAIWLRPREPQTDA